MALDLRLQQKMTQQLVMTPQLQQAIKLLQLSHAEMAEALREELEQNPILEEQQGEDPPPSTDLGAYETPAHLQDSSMETSPVEDTVRDEAEGPSDGITGPSEGELMADPGQVSEAPVDATPEPTSGDVERDVNWEDYADSYSYSLPAGSGNADGDEMPSLEANLSNPTSLLEHLRWQIQTNGLPFERAQIALLLLEEITEDGYLMADAVQNVADELGIEVDDVEEVLLQEVQRLDPTGVGARNLRECLLLQLHCLAHENSTVALIVQKHLSLVERRNYSAIARELKVTVDEVAQAVRIIRALEPRPGRSFSAREPQYITPDIYIHKLGNSYVISLNEEGLPRLRISNYYREAMHGAASHTKSYIQEKLRSASWLMRSIQMRQRTIYKVVESILKFQGDFFDKGVAHLKPLILKEVAEDVGMHESTISRVTANKYVHTPQGIYELKFFFNSSINRVEGDSIASESVRDHIQRLIGGEDPGAPYSDQRIVEILKGHDIDVARRTVAKYREKLRIPSSSRRKRVF